jgi:predicted HicB family RNase H-like nuclease
MENFVIDTSDRKMSSVSRTIRMKEETFDRINEINRQTGVSFNKIVNQCIEYALAHYDEGEQKPST